MMLVGGARGSIKEIPAFLSIVQEVAGRHGVMIQVLNADVVYGRLHLESAYEHAVRAFREKTNATNSLGLETLLYASGESQIQKALGKMGVKAGSAVIAVVLAADQGNEGQGENIMAEFLSEIGFVRDDGVLEGDRETLRRFGVSDREVATVAPDRYGDLVLEKVAMVDVFKR